MTHREHCYHLGSIAGREYDRVRFKTTRIVADKALLASGQRARFVAVACQDNAESEIGGLIWRVQGNADREKYPGRYPE